MTDLVDRAKLFARAAHGATGQLRKYTNEPYINHCVEVAAIVACSGGDEAMIAAAWLHDTVEDTAISLDHIRAEFGSDVADLVDWLTDSQKLEDGNRATRKAREAERLGRAPARAQTIKYADLIHNTGSIVEHDPRFANVYLREKAVLLEKMRAGDAALRDRALSVLTQAKERLKLRE